MQYMKRILLAIICWSGMALAQESPAANVSAEIKMIASIDRFILSERNNFHAYEQMLEEMAHAADSVRYIRYPSNGFVQAFRKFTHDHAEEYTQLRSARFSQYAPPPPALLRLGWDSAGVTKDVAQIAGHFDMLAPAFMRTFEPFTLAQVLVGMMTSSAYEENHDAQKPHFVTRDAYGTRIYTQRQSPGVWQVWAADRRMAITFRVHVATGILEPLARTRIGDSAYESIAWPQSPVKYWTEAEALHAEISAVLWKSYRPEDVQDTQTSAGRDYRNSRLWQFRTMHSSRYQSAIRQQLSLLETPRELPAGFRERTRPGTDLLAYSDSILNTAVNVTPAQWGTTLEAAAFPLLDMNKGVMKLVMRNGYFPVHRYARRLNDAEWAVMIIQETTAIAFTWNIASGKVRDARYWVMEGIAD